MWIGGISCRICSIDGAMAEPVDALDLKPSGRFHGGSIPPRPTESSEKIRLYPEKDERNVRPHEERVGDNCRSNHK